MSNQKQLGLAFMQYAQDYDEQFPYSKGDSPWPVATFPYFKSKQMLRCPSDNRPDTGATANDGWTTDLASALSNGRRTSYTVNGYFVPGEGKPEHGGNFCNLASVQKPSSVIFLAEGAEFQTGTTTPWNQVYFHAHLWPTGRFDVASNTPTDLLISRHLDGFNATYADGHSKWMKWSQVWWRDDSYIATTTSSTGTTVQTPSLKGAFDPRQR